MRDLGFGWKLDISSVKLTVSYPEGSDYFGRRSFRDGTRVVISLPEGTTEGFTFFGQQTSFMSNAYLPRFRPDAGVRSELWVNDVTLTKLNDEYLDASTGREYNPADRYFGNSYELRMRSGQKCLMFADSGELFQISDRDGNVLTFSDFGIEHSGGRGGETKVSGTQH